MTEYKLDKAPNGQWCVVYTDSLFLKPVLVSRYWPIVEQEQFREKDRGITLTKVDTTLYAGRVMRNNFPTSFDVHLANGGQTESVFSQEREIPPPKSRCPVEYREGQWWKRTAKGWVRA